MGIEISFINGLAIIIYLFSSGFSLINYNKTKNYLWILIFGFSFIAILQSLTNVFEWAQVMSKIMDLMESFFLTLMNLVAIVFAIGFKSINEKKLK